MSKVLSMIREFGSVRRNMVIVKIVLLLVLVSVITMGFAMANYSEEVNQGLADNLIRLHVIANSDTNEDQSLKRDVRDVILDYMRGQLKDSKDIEHTKYIVEQDIGKIEELAKKEIQRQGKAYDVKASLGSYPFPTKQYGDITLPAGNYQALRVVIGKGDGANWWCVLFPPLCFVDASHGTVPESVKQDLRKALSKEEYQIITSTDEDEEKDIPVKIKFKVVEFFQSSKMKFTGLLSKLF